MYVHSFSYLVNKLELGDYTYLQFKNISMATRQNSHKQNAQCSGNTKYCFKTN